MFFLDLQKESTDRQTRPLPQAPIVLVGTTIDSLFSKLEAEARRKREEY